MQPRQKLKPDQIEKYSDHYINCLNGSSAPGSSSDEFILAFDDLENCKYLIKSLNTIALETQPQNPKKSLSYLKKAEKLSKSLWHLIKSQNPTDSTKALAQLRSLTLNNLACYYKSTDKLISSYKYLLKASHIEKSSNLSDYELSTTLLNQSAVLSKMKNHEKALEVSLEAINLLEKADEERPIPEVLTTAYYNYAVELEYLQRYSEAKVYYERAYELSEQKYGQDSSMTQNFLSKLAEFNFTHSHLQDSYHSQQSTNNKSNSPNTTQSNEKSPLNLLLTEYKKFAQVRFKVFCINKPAKECIKVLASPKEQYPVYRLVLRYEDIPESCLEGKGVTEMAPEELQIAMKKLLNLLNIEKGALVLHEPSKRRPSISSKTLKKGSKHFNYSEKYF